jgi:hypothetical protein
MGWQTGMKSLFRIKRDAALSARDKRAGHAIRDARMRERLDTPFAVLAVIGLLGLMGIGYFAALSFDRSGAFDPALLRPLPDARIVSNLRDSDAPFIGAASLGDGEGAVLLLRQDGQLARINESTGLVSHSSIDAEEIGLQSNIAALSAGCGRTKAGDLTEACPDPDRLYLLSQDGGLAESDNGRDWRIRLRDAAWIGIDGTPVEQEDITAWASGDAGRYIAILAGVQGLALFDQETDDWIVIDAVDGLSSDETDGAPIHLLYHAGHFWIGTSRGLARLSPTDRVPELEWSSGNDFIVRDLDVTADGDLVALLEGACSANTGTGCLSIEAVDDVDQRRVLVGEVEKIQTLSDDTIRHAVVQDGKIVVVDQGGIFAYDGQRRTWRTVVAGTVDAFWVSAQTGEITATLADRLVQVSDGALGATRDLEGGPFTQIEVTSTGRIIGLARDGQLRDLLNDTVLAARAGAPPLATVFHAGASVDDRVLLASATGLLVHDVRARHFVWKDAATLDQGARQLTNRAVDLQAADGAIWLIDTAQGTVSTLMMTGSMPDLEILVSEKTTLAGPLRSVTSGPQGLFVVDAQGTPFRMTRTLAAPNAQSSVGAARSGSGNFTTAASHSEGLLFATPTQIWNYDEAARGWTQPLSAPPQTQIADISVGDGLFMLSASGRVFRQQGSDWATVVGRGNGAGLGLSDVTDAVASGATLFFGGRGMVQTYDLDASRFGTVYDGGIGDVRIVTLVGGRPVWIANGQLRYGDDLMSPTPVLGAWAAQDGIVALGSGQGNSRFAMHWRVPSDPPDCTFLTAPAPTGRVIDAVEVSGGRVLVVTTSGAGIYVDAERRWLAATGIISSDDLRLHVASGHLVVTTDRNISSVAIDDLPAPDSCALPRVGLEWDIVENGQNVAFDATRGQAAILKNDGQVLSWSDGVLRQVLPAPTRGPDLTVSLQAFQRGDTLVFVDAGAIWRYDMQSRQWARSAIVLPAGAAAITEVDVASEGGGRADVTVWTQSGASYVGVWDAGAARVSMARVSEPSAAPVRTRSDEIADISQIGLNWLVGSAAGIEITRAGLLRSPGIIDFPLAVGVSPTPVTIGQSTAFTVGGRDAPQRLFILPPGSEIASQRGALSALSLDFATGSDRAWGLSEDGATLWRIDGAGAVLSCDVVAGQTASAGCITDLAAPLELDASTVGFVFERDAHTYAVISGVLTQFDRSRRVRTSILGPRPQQDAVAFRVGGEMFLWEGQGRAVWRLDGTSAQDILPEVARMSTENGDVILATPGGLFRLRANAPEGGAEHLNQAVPLSALSYDWRQGGALTGLDQFGNIRSEPGDMIFPLKVPDPQTITRISVSRGQQVWTQRDDGTVTGYEIVACELQRNPHGALGRCVAVIEGAQFANPSGEALLSVTGSRAPVFSFETFEVSFDGAAFGSAQASVVASKLATVSDQRDRFVAQIRPGPTGSSELAPAVLTAGDTRIEDGVGGRLATVERDLVPVPPLSLGWLNWDRGTSGFSVAGLGGARVDLTPAQFIREGRFLLDHSGVARGVAGGGGFEWITPHSIWQFNPATADPVLVALIDLPQPIGLEAGRLLFEDGRGLSQNTQSVDVDTDATAITFGGLDVGTRWRSQSVRADIRRMDGTVLPAFGAVGFAHDIRDLTGWSPQGIVLSTPVGLVPAATFQTVTPRPGNRTPEHVLQVGGRTLAQSGGVWSAYDLARFGWIGAADPFASRVLADMDGVIWSLDGPALSIATTDPAQQWRVQRSGLQFEVDRLRALSASPQAVIVGTGLGTHQYVRAADIHLGGGPADQTVPSTRFDALSVTPDTWVLFSDNGADVWNTEQRRWQAPEPAIAPWQTRRAIDAAGIQVDIFGQSETLARRKIRHIDGSERFALFGWVRGGLMPFDRANAIFAEAGDLYVGTDMGLRLIGAQPGRADVLVDARRRSITDERPVAAVTRVGRPQSNAGRLLARDTAGACLEISAGQSLSACNDPAVIDALFVKSDDLWRWSKRRDTLAGGYVLPNGAERPISNSPTFRWPHDRLAVYAVCAGRSVEVWSDGVTAREGMTTQELEGQPRVAALCQQGRAPVAPNLELEDGLYLLSNDADLPLRQTAPSTWARVDPTLVAAINERAAARWAFEAGRLRIGATGAVGDIYQYRPEAGVWETMPWIAGLPAMDQTKAVFSRDTDVLRVTPLGMMAQTLTAGALHVDPDRVLFRTMSAPGDFASCVPDRSARLDGREHTLATQTGAPVVMRCLDGRVLQEDTAVAADVGAFALTAQDPFSDRAAIDVAGGWRWALDDAQPGSDPAVTVTFKDERVSLAAGRFDLDNYRSIAAPFTNRTSVVAGLGLWDYPGSDMALPGAARPGKIAQHANITAISSDRDQTSGAALLCTTHRDKAPITYLADGTPRQVEACKEWRGQDALFQYRHQGEQGAEALGLAANGPLVARKLLAGQFTDRIATAMPQPMAGANDLLVATPVGASILARNGQTRAIYSHADVLGVALLPGAGPSIMTRNGVFPVSDNDLSCQSLATALGQLPADHLVRSIITSGADLLHLHGNSSDGRFSASLRCDTDQLLALSQQFEVYDRTRHIALMRTMPEATQALLVKQDGDGRLILTDGRTRQVPLAGVEGTLIGIFGATQPRGLVIVTDREVYLIDVDAAISTLRDTPADQPDRTVRPADVPDPEPDLVPDPVPAPVPLPEPSGPVTPEPPQPEAPIPDAPVAPQPISPTAQADALNIPYSVTADGQIVLSLRSAPTAAVVEVQMRLQALGYYEGGIDGDAGPLTRAAIVAYQNRVGAPQTGNLTLAQYQQLVR